MRLFNHYFARLLFFALIALMPMASAQGLGSPEVTPEESSHELLVSVRAFLEEFIDPGKSPHAQAALFSESAEYYDHGHVGTNKIVQDVKRYSRRWPYRHYRLTAIHYITPDPHSDRVFVSYEIDYKVANESRTSSGKAFYGAVITDLAQHPRVEWIKERVSAGN